MLINVNGIGNIATDIELRYTSSSTAVATFSLATNEKRQDKEKVCFIECIVWGKLAETITTYLKKGSKIYIAGVLEQDSWMDKSNSKRYKHKITINQLQMLDCKKTNNNGYAVEYQEKAQSQQQDKKEAPISPEIDINEDEIPF